MSAVSIMCEYLCSINLSVRRERERESYVQSSIFVLVPFYILDGFDGLWFVLSFLIDIRNPPSKFYPTVVGMPSIMIKLTSRLLKLSFIILLIFVCSYN